MLIKSFKFIFSGALICVLDFEISFQDSGGKVSFDILHDLVGMVLIAIGINILRREFSFNNFKSMMTAVLAANIILIVFSLPEYIPGLFSKAIISAIINLYLPVFLIGAILFCLALRSLCQNIGCNNAAKSRGKSLILLLTIYTVPFMALLVFGVSDFYWFKKLNFGFFPIFLIVIVGSTPCFHMLISLKRTINEMSSRPTSAVSDVAIDGNS